MPMTRVEVVAGFSSKPEVETSGDDAMVGIGVGIAKRPKTKRPKTEVEKVARPAGRPMKKTRGAFRFDKEDSPKAQTVVESGSSEKGKSMAGPAAGSRKKKTTKTARYNKDILGVLADFPIRPYVGMPESFRSLIPEAYRYAEPSEMSPTLFVQEILQQFVVKGYAVLEEEISDEEEYERRKALWLRGREARVRERARWIRWRDAFFKEEEIPVEEGKAWSVERRRKGSKKEEILVEEGKK